MPPIAGSMKFSAPQATSARRETPRPISSALTSVWKRCGSTSGGGVFYEVPADNAGGFAALRPVALANGPVWSIEARLGLVFVNGRPMALDSLWRNGTAAKAYWLWRDWTRLPVR